MMQDIRFGTSPLAIATLPTSGCRCLSARRGSAMIGILLHYPHQNTPAALSSLAS